MAEAPLADRLRDHARAFDGLLSLIPAKMYYGEDTSEQWKKTKQTKEEAAAARRGKLDPDSKLNRNAKEVMDERAKNKRKLRELENDGESLDEDDEGYESVDGVEPEQPGQGLRKKTSEPNKKQKVDQNNADASAEPSKKEGKRATRKERRKEKKAEKKAKKADHSPTSAADDKSPSQPDAVDSTPVSKKQKKKDKRAAKDAEDPSAGTVAENGEDDPKQQSQETASEHPDQAPSLDPAPDFSGLQNGDEESGASVPESEPQSPMFDTNTPSAPVANGTGESGSATTSVSSTVPPSEKPKHIKIPADTSALRDRLAAKIAALRAARKADGPDGKPIRTRQELIEARRAKADQRKAHKKELRKQAKLEEQRKREEALASNSPSVMSPAVELDDEAAGNFSFGRVAFDDGSQLSRDLSYVLHGRKKGPSDPKTALLKVQNQKKRAAELDDEKRKDVADKEAWLAARRRAEGDKVRDDEAMLKKAVKRKETAKKKSEKAWQERARGVSQAQRDRQRKREENLRKRRDEKALGKAGKGKKKAGAKKKGGRPGFEGSLGVGGKKK